MGGGRYATMLSFCAAMLAATGLWFVVLLLFLNIAGAAVRIRQEERVMLDEFGGAYAEYR